MCHLNATCTNTDGSYDCHCLSGFIGTGFNCSSNISLHTHAFLTALSLGADVDECGDSSMNNCSENANCTDTIGSYDCTCSEGYSGDGFLCRGIINMKCSY